MAWGRRKRHPLRWIIGALALAGIAWWWVGGPRVVRKDPQIAAAVGPRALISACGVERWAQKTLSDPQADEVLSASPKSSTIRDLNMLLRTVTFVPGRTPEEMRQYEVDGWIQDVRDESDGDVHLVVADDQGFRIVAEFPHPACVGNPAAQERLAQAREQLVEVLSSEKARTGQPTPVRVRGVFFFDRDHGQIGAALNGAELHPVLEIHLRD